MIREEKGEGGSHISIPAVTGGREGRKEEGLT